MRKSALVLVAPFSIVACGSPPPTAAPSVAQQTVAITPTPPPPPLVDPPNLVNVAKPANAICELAGNNLFSLATTADGPALFHVGTGPTKLTIGSQGEAFVEASTPSFTIHGFVAQDASRDRSLVYAAKWLSFGGVYFPGLRDAMQIGVHDGKISLTAPDDRGFHFAGTNGTLDVECDDLGLSPDANRVLRNGLPPAFEKHDGKLSVLNYTKSVSLSAEADGPAIGTFDVKEGPATVTVIERKGKKAHVRTDHFIGWIDASALKPFNSKNVGPLTGDEVGGVVGGVESIPWGGVVGVSKLSTASTLTCTNDVRILVVPSASPSTPFAIGTIPAGKPVRLSSRDDDNMSTLVLDDDPKNPRVGFASPNRFAAANKDLVSCTPTTDARPVVRSVDDVVETIDMSNEQDAIDALPAETPKKAPAPKAAPPCKSLACIGTTNANREYPITELGINQPPRANAVEMSANATGALTLATFKQTMQKYLSRFRACYQKALSQDPSVAGHFSIHASIDAKGNVTQTTTSSNDIADANMRMCVDRMFHNIVFPAASGSTDANYIIRFMTQ